MWKPIIVVRNKKYAMEAQKRQKQWNLGKPGLRGGKKKNNYVTFTTFQVVNTLSGRQQATKNHIIKWGVGKRQVCFSPIR